MPAPRKNITFDFTWFWGTVGAIIVTVFGGFWAFHRAQLGDLRDADARELEAERRHLNANHEQAVKQHLAEHSAKQEALKLEGEGRLKEVDYKSTLELAAVGRKADNDRELFHRTLDSLRKDLAASRASVELKADGGYLSVTELIVDENEARRLASVSGYTNAGHLLMPNYETRGWQFYPSVSFAQYKAYVDKDEFILVPPDGVDPEKDMSWAPLFSVFVRKGDDSEGIVGMWSFTADKLESVVTMATGVKSEENKVLTSLPPGMIAYIFASGILLSDKLEKQINDNAVAEHKSETATDKPDASKSTVKTEPIVVRDFSARNDAFYMSSTSVFHGKPFENELLFTRSGNRYVCAFSTCNTKDALDPLRKEARDWVKSVRIIKQ